MITEQSTVDTFLAAYFPKTLDGLVAFIDDLKDSGKIETLDDLRAELVKLSLSCREYAGRDNR
jgi:hypothetical protein